MKVFLISVDTFFFLLLLSVCVFWSVRFGATVFGLVWFRLRGGGYRRAEGGGSDCPLAA